MAASDPSDPPPSDPTPGHRPPWQAAALFPEVPTDAPCGVVGAGGPLPGQDADDLASRLRRDAKRAIALAWTPASGRLVPIGEVPALAAPLVERDLPFWRNELRRGGLLAAGSAFGILATLAFLPPLLLLPLFLGMQGLAQVLAARQALRNLADPDQYAREQAVALRFCAWSAPRPWRGTQILAGVLGAVMVLLTMVGPGRAFPLVELDPAAVREGEWWRLATAGLVHANLAHLLLNVLALLSLGRLVEVLAGWQGMLLAFAVGVLGGNALSGGLAWSESSLGASSGLCGLLGWLLVVVQPRVDGLPASLRSAVQRNVWLVALLGVIGATVIDHLAHVGGLAAGAGVAALNGRRLPARDPATRALGVFSAVAILATAGFIALRVGRLALD